MHPSPAAPPAAETRPIWAVVLPGTGSDADFAARAFDSALGALGVAVTAVDPDPDGLIDGYLRALDDAAADTDHDLIVGGISIGAAVAVQWCAAHPGRAVAALAAMPAWTGSPTQSSAAASARYTAQCLRRDGLEATITQMRTSSPAWLGDELARSWAAQWPSLPDAMEEAAGHVGPTSVELEAVETAVGIAAVEDDPLHPLAVGLDWYRALPRARLRTVVLDEVGADPAVLGQACVHALRDLWPRLAAPSTVDDPPVPPRRPAAG